MRINILMVVENYPSKYQTFVDYQVDALKGIVYSLYGSSNNYFNGNVFYSGESTPSGSLVRKIWRRIMEYSVGINTPQLTVLQQDKFKKTIEENSPDVVLAQFGPVGMAIADSGVLGDLPLVVHFHGYDASSMLRHKKYRERLPVLFDHSSGIIVVSNNMKNTLIRMGCSEQKIAIIPCGANLDKIGPREISEGERKCTFISVSRLIPGKGPLETIRAFAECQKENPNVKLVFIGEGPLRDKMEKLISRYKLENKIILRGLLSHEETLRYLSTCDVLVQHSQTTKLGGVEGWGVSLAEGASAGLPIISTMHGGIPDQVVDGKTGFLVKEGDWETMAKKMLLLANNPNIRKKMGGNAREHISKVGNAALQVEKLRGFLEDIVTAKSTILN